MNSFRVGPRICLTCVLTFVFNVQQDASYLILKRTLHCKGEALRQVRKFFFLIMAFSGCMNAVLSLSGNL